VGCGKDSWVAGATGYWIKLQLEHKEYKVCWLSGQLELNTGVAG
jgi:hypothetical protein